MPKLLDSSCAFKVRRKARPTTQQIWFEVSEQLKARFGRDYGQRCYSRWFGSEFSGCSDLDALIANFRRGRYRWEPFGEEITRALVVLGVLVPVNNPSR